MSDYMEFLTRKHARVEKPGNTIETADVHPMLHTWQSELVQWAVATSRAALWADTGMGKTFMQIEWARLSREQGALIIAPLAVCQQTIREAEKLGHKAFYVRDSSEVNRFGICVTNYERVPALNPALFDAVVLDESSILKQSTGATRTMLIDWAKDIPHRLACSATPAPTAPFPGAHFAVFPVALPQRCILAGCKPGGTVLDPFNGSGTTGLAAQKTGRKYIGIDLNAEYLDLSLRTRLHDAVLDFGDPA